MLGASARWSRLHTPVETGTPPYRSRRSCVRDLLVGIVTHSGVEVCYNSMKLFAQVPAIFTISFTGVTLASSR